MKTILSLFFLLFLFVSVANAISVERWGPGGGGYCTSIKIDPNDSNTIYFTTDLSGVYKSTDGGSNWKSINEGLINYKMGEIVIHPNDSNILWVASSAGPYKSTDKGESWVSKRTGLPAITQAGPGRQQDDIRSVYIYPQDTDIMFIGSGSTTFCREHDVYSYAGWKSTDAGENWTAIPNGNGGPNVALDLTVNSFAMDPLDSNTVYLGSTQGLYKSTDGGTNWTRMDNQGSNPMGEDHVVKIETVQDSGTELYAATRPDCSATGGLYYSSDSGSNWSKVNPSGHSTSSCNYFKLTGSDDQDIVAFFKSQLATTSNGGTSWSVGNKPNDPGWLNFTETANNASVWSFDVLSSNTNRIFTIFNAPLLTTDGGTTWSAKYTTQDAQSPFGWSHTGYLMNVPMSVFVDPDDKDHIIINDGDYTLQRSQDGGVTWLNYEGYFHDNHTPSPDDGTQMFKDGSTYYATLANHAGDPGWTYLYTSTDADTWTKRKETSSTYELALCLARKGATLKVFIGMGSSGVDWSTNLTDWTSITGKAASDYPSRIIQDPNNDDNIYIAYRYTGSDGGIFKSTNYGVDWTDISNHANLRDVRAIVVKPGDSNTILAGTRGYSLSGTGGIYKSTNGGTDWSQVDTTIDIPHEDAGSSKKRWCSSLAYNSSGSILVAGFRAEGHDAANNKGAWYSFDDGASWNKIPGVAIESITEVNTDPHDELIFYVSSNGGGVNKITFGKTIGVGTKTIEIGTNTINVPGS